jgi:hypothetical protein
MLIGLGLVALGFVAGAVAADVAGKGIVRWTTADIKWTPVPGTPGMMAEAWTSASGAHCNFNKFPKGTKIPLHSHTADISAVVLSGQFGSVEEGGAMKLGGSSAYQFIPAGLKHSTECGAGADCVIFACQPGAFDLVEASPAKK